MGKATISGKAANPSRTIAAAAEASLPRLFMEVMRKVIMKVGVVEMNPATPWT